LKQYRRVTDSQPATHPASHVAVASTRYAYLRRVVKMVNFRNETICSDQFRIQPKEINTAKAIEE